MEADVRIDPDGTTWIRIDAHGQAYWFRHELLKEPWVPASHELFSIKVQPEPQLAFHLYSPTVRARWNIPFTTGVM
jgi:hypothetical protein